MYHVQQPVAGAKQPQCVSFDTAALLLLLLLLFFAGLA
jgi:hypothetical protein